MNKRRPPLLLLAALLGLSQCKKHDPDPVEQLPPATQTGANTFGCLINGQPYMPQGRVGLGANFYISYDPTFQGGYLTIGTYQVDKQREQIAIDLRFVPIPSSGTYSLNLPGGVGGAGYTNSLIKSPCGEIYSDSSLSFRKGTLVITRLDLKTGIIAGTFEMKFVQPGCDTIRITQGRFDGKL